MKIGAFLLGLLLASTALGALANGWTLTTENTGLASVGLTCAGLPLYTGGMKPAANTTISNVRITWEEFDLSNGNITLDRVCIQPTTAGGRSSIVFGYNPDTGDDQLGPATITNSDIDGTLIPNSQATIFANCGVRGAFSMYNVKIFGTGSGVCYFGAATVQSDTIERVFVYGLRSGMYGSPPQQSHNESATVRGFTGTGNASLRWINNRLESYSGADSGAMFIQAGGIIRNVYLVGNLFSTPSWGLYLENSGGGAYSGMQAVNNRWEVPPGAFGDVAVNNGVGFILWHQNYRYNAGGTDGQGSVINPPSPYNSNIAPTAAITAPTAGASVPVNTATTVTATAADSGGTVSQVQIKAGNTVICTDTTSPYSCSWTPTVTGAVVLTSETTDNLNGLIISSPVNVTVTSGGNVAPSVSVTAPANGASIVVNTAQTITATASDSDGTVSQVVFKVDGATICTDTTSPYSCSWTPTATGSDALTAEATDNSGATAVSSAVNVTVTAAPDTTNPTVSISAPADGTTVSGTAVNVAANAADNVGVVGVQFRVDGVNVGAEDTTSPYSISWNSTTVANGSRVITAVARDAAGNTATSAGVTVTVNNVVGAPAACPNIQVWVSNQGGLYDRKVSSGP